MNPGYTCFAVKSEPLLLTALSAYDSSEHFGTDPRTPLIITSHADSYACPFLPVSNVNLQKSVHSLPKISHPLPTSSVS